MFAADGPCFTAQPRAREASHQQPGDIRHKLHVMEQHALESL